MPTPDTPRMPSRTIDETARLGRKIYLQTILPLVEADHFGEYVLIDVDTGNWTIDESSLLASKRLREKHPDAIDLWCERVGYKAPASFGGGVRLGRPKMIEGAVNAPMSRLFPSRYRGRKDRPGTLRPWSTRGSPAS